MKPEMAVRGLVHSMGYRYRLHSPLLPGRPDLVFTKLRKIIEVRGCFWHQHKGCVDSHVPKTRQSYWVPKLRRNKERDSANLKVLRKLGWQVYVVWECETSQPQRLSPKLQKFLDS